MAGLPQARPDSLNAGGEEGGGRVLVMVPRASSGVNIANDLLGPRGKAAADAAVAAVASTSSPVLYTMGAIALAATTCTGYYLYRKATEQRRKTAHKAYIGHNQQARSRRRSSTASSNRVNPDDPLFFTHFPYLMPLQRLPGLTFIPFVPALNKLTEFLVRANETSPVLFYIVILIYTIAFIGFTVITSLIMMQQLGSRAAVASIAATAGTNPFGLPVPLAPLDNGCKTTAQWPGWANVKYAFVFGDSYSQTGFNYAAEPAPSPGNPLGNPPYPGFTSANGPCWVDYLTVEYNASILQTYNLAYGGATVDADLVEPYAPTVLSIKDQVRTEFVPGYSHLLGGNTDTTSPPTPDWHGNDSLFAVWVGVNDVGNSYSRGADVTATLNRQITDELCTLVGTLYDAGGRNFAFLNVPPVDRSPLAASHGTDSQTLEAADIADFNERLGEMASALKEKHSEVNVWLFDTHTPFGQVLDKPSSFAQTAHLKNTTEYCAGYQNGTPEPTTLIPSCNIPVNEYFWLNSLHPTYPVHAVIADQLSKTLSAGPNVCKDKKENS